MSDGYKLRGFYIILGSVIIASSIFYLGYTISATQRYLMVGEKVFLDTKTGLVCENYDYLYPDGGWLDCYDIKFGAKRVDDGTYGIKGQKSPGFIAWEEQQKALKEQQKAERQQKIDDELANGCRFLTDAEKQARLPLAREKEKVELEKLERECKNPDSEDVAKSVTSCLQFYRRNEDSNDAINASLLSGLSQIMLCPGDKEISVVLP